MPSKKKNSQKNTGMAVLAYIIFFIPLLSEAKNDPFVKFHTKQGLALFILFLCASVIKVIPLLGWVISPILWVFGLVLMIIGIVNAANGEKKELPIIGQYVKNLKL